MAIPRIRRVWALLGLSSWLAIAGAGAPALGQAQPLSEAASWLSEDTLLYAEVRKPEALVDQLRKVEVEKALLQVPQVAKALEDKQFRELRAVVGVLAQSQGKDDEQLLRDLVAGGFVVAVEAPDRILAIIEPRTAETLERAQATLLKMARDDAAAKGKPEPFTSVEHGGSTIYEVGGKVAHAVVKGKLVLATQRGLVERLIDRMNGGASHGGALADNAAWAARHDQFQDESGAFAFARFDRLRVLDENFMKVKAEDRAGTVFVLGAWFEALRLADSVSAIVRWPKDRIEAALDVRVAPKAIPEAMGRFQPTEGKGAAPLLEPEGMLASVSLWRDFSSIWEVRDQILPAEALPGLAQLDTFAGQFFGGRDFGTGVLGSLGSEWRLVVVQQDYSAMNPAPDTKLPGFALVLNLNPEDEQFAVRLQTAFQSFVALVNLDSAQKKNPTLLLGSETFEGITFTKSTYLVPRNRDAEEPYETRFNFAPCAAQVGNTFILSSSVDTTRRLIQALKARSNDAAPLPATLEARIEGAEVARLFDLNRETLVMRNMLEKGNDKASAEAAIDLVSKLIRFMRTANLRVQDREDGVSATLAVELNP